MDKFAEYLSTYVPVKSSEQQKLASQLEHMPVGRLIQLADPLLKTAERGAKDGSGKGKGRPEGLRRNKNDNPCPLGGPGNGEGGGKGQGLGRVAAILEEIKESKKKTAAAPQTPGEWDRRQGLLAGVVAGGLGGTLVEHALNAKGHRTPIGPITGMLAGGALGRMLASKQYRKELEEKMRKKGSISPAAMVAAESLHRSIKLARQMPAEMAGVSIKTAASTLNDSIEKVAIGKGTSALLGALGGGAVAGGVGYGAYKHSQKKNFRAGVLKTPSGYQAIAGPSSKIRALKKAIKERNVKALRAASKGVAKLHPGYTYRANVASAMQRLKAKKKG